MMNETNEYKQWLRIDRKRRHNQIISRMVSTDRGWDLSVDIIHDIIVQKQPQHPHKKTLSNTIMVNKAVGFTNRYGKQINRRTLRSKTHSYSNINSSFLDFKLLIKNLRRQEYTEIYIEAFERIQRSYK